MFLEKIKEAKAQSKPRNFTQTWDLTINLTGIDLKKPENRFNLEFALPGGRGKDIKVAVIADSLAAEAEKCADLVIRKAEIETLAKDKKRLKKIVNEYEWFLAEAPLMPLIGKTLGVVMGTRGKMPKPVPPRAKIEPFVSAAKRSVRIRLRENPVLHIPVGTDKMPEEAVAKNAEAVYNFIRDRLPKGRVNIKSAQIKLTMGKPVKLEVK